MKRFLLTERTAERFGRGAAAAGNLRGNNINNNGRAPSVFTPSPPAMPALPADMEPVIISGAVSGQGGRYQGKTFARSITSSASGGLQDSDIGTAASGQNCIVWNLCEIPSGGSATGNALTTPLAAMAFRSGVADQASGYPILLVAINVGGQIVTLTNTGGSDGSYPAGGSATKPTYQYTVVSLGGTTLATAQTITGGSIFSGHVTPATIGRWETVSTGTMGITWNNESTGGDVCNT